MVQRIIGKTGFVLARKSSLEQTKDNAIRDIEIIRRYSSPSLVTQVIESLSESKAQFRQDVFALAESGFKREGYFVEFGGTDGITGSNSYLLESQFGWKGVIAEPAARFHAELVANRNCVCDFRAVWSQTGEILDFKEAKIGAISTFKFLESRDQYRRYRKQGKVYPVETVSLLDLLIQAKAPREIDFLSVDTEGSELAILKAFDFSRFRFNAISVEHNFGPNRSSIRRCLEEAGYRQVHQDISGVDDWFVPAV
tara:strand:- start:1031 stop:1792 length:762 start_codon:yes stop_codon:yes gene_type:complete